MRILSSLSCLGFIHYCMAPFSYLSSLLDICADGWGSNAVMGLSRQNMFFPLMSYVNGMSTQYFRDLQLYTFLQSCNLEIAVTQVAVSRLC